MIVVDGVWHCMKSTPQLQKGLMVMMGCRGDGGAQVLEVKIWNFLQCIAISWM
jgi:hypothetical protein